MSDRQKVLDEDKKHRQECIGRCRAHINSREHLTEKQKADAVSRMEKDFAECEGQLEKRLAEVDRQYYETKAFFASCRTRRYNNAGPIQRFIYNFLGTGL